MPSKKLNKSAFSIDGPEKKILVAILIITVFCFAYISMHPYHADVESSKVNANNKSVTNSLKAATYKSEPSLSALPTPVNSSDQNGVTASTNTTSPQSNNASSSINNQVTPDISSTNLQASQTSGDPDELNITVPKNTVKKVTKTVTNLVIK
jgi:hypothetical protein